MSEGKRPSFSEWYRKFSTPLRGVDPVVPNTTTAGPATEQPVTEPSHQNPPLPRPDTTKAEALYEKLLPTKGRVMELAPGETWRWEVCPECGYNISTPDPPREGCAHNWHHSCLEKEARREAARESAAALHRTKAQRGRTRYRVPRGAGGKDQEGGRKKPKRRRRRRTRRKRKRRRRPRKTRRS